MQIFKWVPAKVEELTQSEELRENHLISEDQTDATRESTTDIPSDLIKTQNGTSKSATPDLANAKNADTGTNPFDIKDKPISVVSSRMNKENLRDVDFYSNSTSSLNSDYESQPLAAPDEPSKIVTLTKDEIVKSIASKQESFVLEELAKVKREEEEEEELGKKIDKGVEDENDLEMEKSKGSEKRGLEHHDDGPMVKQMRIDSQQDDTEATISSSVEENSAS